MNTSRRGTPSVQRAMGCDTQSRSACTRQDRLRLRQRTHCPNLRKSSPNPRPDQSYRCRGWCGLRSTLGFCSRRAAFGALKTNPRGLCSTLELWRPLPGLRAANPRGLRGTLELSRPLQSLRAANPRGLRGTFELSRSLQGPRAANPRGLRSTLELSRPLQGLRAANPPGLRYTFARVGPANKSNPNGLRGIWGHVDDRRGQSAWPAQHFRPPRLSARPHPAGLRDTCGHSPYTTSFGPPAKPICVTCAIVAVVWATVNATPRGLPRLGGHPGHRRGHSAWPAEYSRPFMRPAKLICIACAMLWSTGGRHKASAEPFRVGLALARHRATCAAMWALGKADARSKRERNGIGTARAAQHSRPFGPSARSLRDPTSREKSSAGRGPRCTCGHFGHW